MQEVGITEFGGSLTTLLAKVASGEEITITSGGKAVARLVPPAPEFDRARAQLAAKNLLDASRGVTLGGLRIKDLISEGRR